MTAVAETIGSGFWPELRPQRSDSQRNIISIESPHRRVSRDVSGAFVVHARAGVAVDSWQWEGHAVRTVARKEADLNGSMIESLFANATSGTPSSVVIPFTPPKFQGHHTPEARRVARLTEIQASLGLSMQTLAEVLQISRPQLYKWFDVGQAIRLQEESATRLNAVVQLAQAWRGRSMAPLGPWLHEQAKGGRSLLDLLTSKDLQLAEIERTFDGITGRFGQAPKSRSQRMREAGFSRRATHRSLPSDE